MSSLTISANINLNLLIFFFLYKCPSIFFLVFKLTGKNMVDRCVHFAFSRFRVFPFHLANAKSGNREIEKVKLRNLEIEKSRMQKREKHKMNFSISCFLLSRFPDFLDFPISRLKSKRKKREKHEKGKWPHPVTIQKHKSFVLLVGV